MANAQTQAIVMKNFSGGIWLNEGDPPNNTYAPFVQNLDILFSGGMQKRAPVRKNYKILSGSNFEELWWQPFLGGSMSQWLQADPSNGLRYVILDWFGQAVGNVKMKCFDRTTSTIVWTATVGVGIVAFDYASSDAGARWYLHQGANLANISVDMSGTPSTLNMTPFNDNVAAPVNGMMPSAFLGCQHLAYYFLGHTNESGDKPNRIRWSHPGRFEDFRTNDKQDVGDASKIIGLYSVNDTLLIVKETQVWAMTGFDSTTFAFRKIADISASSPYATVTRSAGCSHSQFGAFIYLADAGVYRWDGKKWDDISGGLKDAIVDGRVKIKHMTIIGDVLYCSTGKDAPTSGADAATDLSWQYNLRNQAWTQHTAPFVGLAPIQSTTSGSPRAYAVHQHGTNGGYTFSFYQQKVAAGSWADNWPAGVDIDIVCQYRTPWQDARNPARKKRWRRPWIVANKRPNASAADPVTYGTSVFRNWDGVHAAKTGTISAAKATDTTDYDANYAYGHATTGSDFDEGLKIQALGSAFSVQLLLSSSGTPKDQWGFDSLTFKYVPMVLR